MEYQLTFDGRTKSINYALSGSKMLSNKRDLAEWMTEWPFEEKV